MIPFVVIMFLIVAVGAGVLAYRGRPQSSIESGVHAFRREMQALAPPPEHRRGPEDGTRGSNDVPTRDHE